MCILREGYTLGISGESPRPAVLFVVPLAVHTAERLASGSGVPESWRASAGSFCARLLRRRLCCWPAFRAWLVLTGS
jgi:hypothetical protein